MSEREDKIKELQKRMLQKRMYVVFTTAVKPTSEMLALIPDHLDYIIDLEKRGMLFASGPFFDEAHRVLGNGMTILRAASRAEAEAIAQEDPLYKSEMRTYEVKEWQINEGSYTVTVNYSDGSYSIS